MAEPEILPPCALPKPGDVIGGRYEVERIVGRGGMGIVFAARHVLLGEPAAIKVLVDGDRLSPEAVAMGGDAPFPPPQAIARFLAEARAAARIQSAHVARVFDAGMLESGLPFMALELLEGTDLRAVVAERGPLSVDEAASYVLEALAGVAEAHALGIVHRDLKPSNLFLARRRDGTCVVKVLDFGIAKSLDGELGSGSPNQEIRTSSRTLLGSPEYMSPEQLRRAKAVDVRSDVWSLGVVLYNLLTAEMPFVGESLPDLMMNITAGALTPIRAHRKDLPEAVEAIVARCLAIDPAARFPDVGALAEALAGFARPELAPLVRQIQRAVASSRRGADDSARDATRDAAPTQESRPPPPTSGDRAQATTQDPWTAHAPRRRPRSWSASRVGLAAAVVGVAATALLVRFTAGTASPPAHPSEPASDLVATQRGDGERPPSNPLVVDSRATGNLPAASAATSASPAPDLPSSASEASTTRPPSAAPPLRPPAPRRPVCTTVSYAAADGATHLKQVCR